MYEIKTFYSLKRCVEYANKNNCEIISIIRVPYLDVDKFEMVYKKK